MKKKIKGEFCWQLIFSLILGTITYVVVFKQIGRGSDYNYHMLLARDLSIASLKECTYPLWHIGTRVLYQCFKWMQNNALEIAAALFTAIVNVVTYYVCDFVMEKYGVKLHSMWTFLLLLVGPLYVPAFNHNYYLGQGTPNTWHNPTNLIVKPFAVMAFYLSIQLIKKIEEKSSIKKWEWGVYSAILVASVLAKPSFIQGFAPAIFLYIVWNAITHNKDKERFKQYIYLLLCYIPAMLCVVAQFFLVFFGGSSGGGVGIGWLTVLSSYTPNVFISLLLGLAFPILYLALNWKQIRNKPDIQLSLLFVIVSWLEAAVLYENGGRKYHGNFTWALMMAYSVIWLVTVCNWKGKTDTTASKDCFQRNLLNIVFAAHLLLGIRYIFEVFIGNVA